MTKNTTWTLFSCEFVGWDDSEAVWDIFGQSKKSQGLNLDLLNCCFQILSLSYFFDPKITKFGWFLCSLIFCASGERETTLNQNYFCAQAEKGQWAQSWAKRAANRRRSVNQTEDRTKTKNSDRHHGIPQSQILEKEP